MIAQELEVSLHMAFVEARQQRHEFITVEHLLMALLDNPSAAEVLRACAANIEDLRKSLATFIKENTPTVGGSDEVDTQPTLGFQRVIQRAIMHVQSTGSGKKEVTGANVLVAIFGEKDSHAVYYLHQQGVTRLDVVNFIAHGIKKNDPPEPAKGSEGSSGSGEGEKEEPGDAKGSPLEQFTQNLNAAGARRQDRPADRPRARGRARDPGAVPPAQEQPAAGRRGRRRQDRHRRRPGLAHHREGRARGAGRRHRLRAGHGRAAGRHQVPRRLRAAPEGRAQAAEGPAGRDPLHRRDPHPDRRRRGQRRHAGRQQPAQAGAEQRRHEVHRRHHLHRVPRHLREGRGAVAALPEGRRGRALGRADDRDPEGPEVALRGAPQRQVRADARCRRRPSCRPSTSTTATCPTRPSTSSTRPVPRSASCPRASARRRSTAPRSRRSWPRSRASRRPASPATTAASSRRWTAT